MRAGSSLAVGTLFVLVAAFPCVAASPGSTAYPDNPSGTPSTDSKGAAPTPAPCNGSNCPDKPAASGKATSETSATGTHDPATAYPGSPGKTPAAEGQAPH